jgi:hypothetical protein
VLPIGSLCVQAPPSGGFLLRPVIAATMSPVMLAAVSRNGTRDALRINVGAARLRDDLRRPLEIIAELMSSGHLHLNDVA